MRCWWLKSGCSSDGRGLASQSGLVQRLALAQVGAGGGGHCLDAAAGCLRAARHVYARGSGFARAYVGGRVAHAGGKLFAAYAGSDGQGEASGIRAPSAPGNARSQS
jgi:hypothetical protein